MRDNSEVYKEKNPHAHLISFVEMCNTFSILVVTSEGIRLYLFPYTLQDEAKRWAHSLEQNEINYWDQLVERFMKKFFPPAVNARRQGDVLNFEHMENETLSTAWVRFRRLVKNCPHFEILDCVLMETFYNGLYRSMQVVAEASAAEGFMDKMYTEAKVILDRILQNTDDWVDNGYGGRGPERRKAESAIIPVDIMTTLAAQMATVTSLLQMMAINHGTLSQGAAQDNTLAQVAVISCAQCGEGHSVEMCPSNPQAVYSIQNNPYNNTYNPGWRNHPNFNWGGNNDQGGQRNLQNNSENRGNPPVFHQGLNQSHHQSRQSHNQPSSSNFSTNSSSLEALLKQYIEKNDAVMQSQASSIRNLEVQMGQLAAELRNRALGMMPSNSEAPGSNGKEQCQ
ncbi:uncharacterized protein LOC120089170 [Benincasa hispida]|uniref:uncharacterized protein LOC120089170 n=1 Tax=Benincasa hispida TaxID=102211 RepID=UPI001900EA95|nr:uncharacterized protein LOC120089170 [Benincasa hispida]